MAISLSVDEKFLAPLVLEVAVVGMMSGFQEISDEAGCLEWLGMVAVVVMMRLGLLFVIAVDGSRVCLSLVHELVVGSGFVVMLVI